MRSRLLTMLGATTLTLGGLLASAGSTSADPGFCYNWTTHPDRYFAQGIGFGNGTNIRRGPDVNCDSFGLGYPSHGIDVHCYVYNADGHGWVYLRDTTTGVDGWSQISALNYDGSGIKPC